jgi:hypothetical protein
MGDILIPQSMQRMPGLVGKLNEPATNAGNGMEDGLRSPSCSSSTPDQDHDHDLELLDHDVDLDEEEDVKSIPQQEQQPLPQKRKGGRKPVRRPMPFDGCVGALEQNVQCHIVSCNRRSSWPVADVQV